MALIAASEANMPEVLGHVQLSSSTTTSSSSNELVIVLTDLCVAPHLQARYSPSFQRVESTRVTLRSAEASARPSSVSLTVTCHVQPGSRQVLSFSCSAPLRSAGFTNERAMQSCRPAAAAAAAARLPCASAFNLPALLPLPPALQPPPSPPRGVATGLIMARQQHANLNPEL